jgi:hypothetical protein
MTSPAPLKPFRPSSPGKIGGGIKTSTFVAIVAPLLAMLAVGLALVSPDLRIHIPFLTPSPVTPPGQCSVSVPAQPRAPYIGVAPGKPWQANVAAFSRVAGGLPQVVETYQSFPAKFPTDRICDIAHQGELSVIQWNPRVSMAAIAAGHYDRYLNDYARSVREYGHPVVLSFAHEMNGEWFSWGYTHTSRQTFIAAWRHVHTVLAGDGDKNVTWLWNVNRDTHNSQPSVVSPPRDWWPGAGYVNWLGIDAYFNSPADSFGSVFERTLADFRKFSRDPVLITETAVAPNPAQAAQIRGLFAGVDRRRLLGFIWFDANRREDWKLEGRPQAGQLFRQGVRIMRGRIQG